ncbi:hypothetical protein FB192DRAFT_1350631 [Mucor lusitanicus]|uniref:Uncharacterized protein n=1 Tax=Mucor circinelloides f. lusitanicus TaxID=29924 RepID=A0A8H4BS81_MUCCL|nr:hypothetical protein FB192DRAFT_1350631 [Mucor lusitanicus]
MDLVVMDFAMVYFLMHCIAGSAALFWSNLAFFLFFFKCYFFCNTGGIGGGVLTLYEATTILFSTMLLFSFFYSSF